MRPILDLMREADSHAVLANARMVTAAHVEQAIEAQQRRSGRLRARMLEDIRHGVILIDSTGSRVGQVNGLSVIKSGEHAFGHTLRITARAWVGKGEVVDIERDVELGGPLHSKGVLICRGLLGARYATECPLSLSASLVFEQSYANVDGDSASVAEACALLSALSELPVLQSIAITGSLNQQGDVQAIGGVNEKIEGFFDSCRITGFTGRQGVIIPASNVRHLMLRRDVVAAAEEGKFRVYPIDTVDQGLELLTGIPAGEPDAAGEYPPGTLNQRIAARLDAFAAKAAELGRLGPDAGSRPKVRK
jgi:predicted ATP-dependent protease